MDVKRPARAAVIGLVAALGAATAAEALTVVINPPSKRTRGDACSFLASLKRGPNPFHDKSATAARAQKQAVALATRAYADICVVHKAWPDPPIYADGSQHFGALLNGKPDGLGVRFYGDGSRYIGEWKDGLRQGQGMGIQADGARYVGHWDADQPHGQGAVQYHSQLKISVEKK